jgi:hypothetical protein
MREVDIDQDIEDITIQINTNIKVAVIIKMTIDQDLSSLNTIIIRQGLNQVLDSLEVDLRLFKGLMDNQC